MAVIHAFLNHNDLFNAYIAIAPSLWWDDQIFSRIAEEKIETMNLDHKILYFSMGSDELPVTIRDAFTFSGILKAKAAENLSWKYDFINNEGHSSQEPIAVYNGLRFVFNGWSFSYEKLRDEGLTYVLKYFTNLEGKYGYKFGPTETDLNGYAYLLVRMRKLDEAIEVGKKLVHDFPRSPNSLDSLGEIYLAAGKVDLAIENYKKAVALAEEVEDRNISAYKANLEKALEAKARK